MLAYDPKLYFFLGWRYKTRPSSPYEAPSGTVTVAGNGLHVPCGADKEIALYLCDLARRTPPNARGTTGSLADLSC